MASGKKSFIAYADWKDVFDSIPDEHAGRLIKHIFAYVNDENPTSEDVIVNALFVQIRSTLKRDLQKWENQKEQRRLAGLKSAQSRSKSNENQRPLTTVDNRKRTCNETERNSTVICNMLDVSDSVSENDKSVKLDSGENNFSPTPEEDKSSHFLDDHPEVKKEKSSAKKEKSIPDRKQGLKERLYPFLEKYSREMLNDFYSYWTEMNEGGKKMRFEMQKVFDVGRRLATWAKNEKNNFYGGKQVTASQSRQQRVDEVAEFRKLNQQIIIERLQKHSAGSHE